MGFNLGFQGLKIKPRGHWDGLFVILVFLCVYYIITVD